MRWDEWFEMWCADKESVLNYMIGNMVADLNAGYDYFGKSIVDQRREIERYREEYHTQMMQFADWEEKKVGRWCYYDLRRRGAIT